MKNVKDDSRVRAATRELEKIQKNIEAKKKELVRHNEKTFAGNDGIGRIIYRFPEDGKMAEALIAEIKALETSASQAESAVLVAQQEAAAEIKTSATPGFLAIRDEIEIVQRLRLKGILPAISEQGDIRPKTASQDAPGLMGTSEAIQTYPQNET